VREGIFRKCIEGGTAHLSPILIFLEKEIKRVIGIFEVEEKHGYT
jgi:hypothetical protein